MKECSKCKKLKTTSEFYKDSKNKDGLWSYCKTCKSAQRKEYYQNNKEKEKKNATDWISKNREKHNQYYRAYYLNNKDKEHARSVLKRARRIKRTVKWADKDKIQDFYKEAQRLSKETGKPHHVDHIIPLKGKLVSGLHVENNLQVIPAFENLSKSNKFDPNTTVKGEQ